MKTFYVLVLSICSFTMLKAQNVSNYFFKVRDGIVLEDMSTATPVLIPTADGSSYSPADVGIVLTFPDGFTFNFNGTNYSHYSIAADGMIVLGSTPVTLRDFDNPLVPTSGGDVYYNDIHYPAIAPFATALNYPADGSIKSKVVQTSGDRKLVIEWKANKYDGNGANKLFQLWIFEKSGLVQFVYGDAYVDNYVGSVIGIASSSSDFVSVNVQAGSASSTDAPIVYNVWPGRGVSYLLSPTPITNATISANGAATTFCAGGSVTLSASLETFQPTAYQWYKDNVAINNATASTYSATQSGNYSVVISFAGGSASANAVSVTANPVPTVTANVRNISCNGSNNGSITLTGSDVSTSTINWAGPNSFATTGSQISHLPAGVYTYTISGANGCAAQASANIVEPDSLILNVSASNRSSSITVTTNGTYTISDINNNDVTQNTSFGPGTYTINAFKAGGNAGEVCTASKTVTIQQILLSATASPKDGTCNGTNDATITVSDANGGSGSYEYSIDGKTWQTNPNFTGVATGTYNVQVRDALNQSNVKAVGVVAVKKSGAAPVVSISQSAPAFSANISLTANSSTAISYNWSNNATTQTINLSNAANDGNYTVTVTDAKACTATATYNYIKQNSLNSYTVVGLNTVYLGENNNVTGSVGNTAAGQQVIINKNSSVKGSIKAPVVTLAQPVNVTGTITYAAATMVLPAMYNNTSNTKYLPSITIRDDYNGLDITGNYSQITIGKRAKVKLTGKVFGTITIKEGADVTLNSSDVSIDALTMDNGKVNTSSTDYTTISFASNTIIRIKNKVTIGEENVINALGSTFYIGDANPDMERIVISGKNTTFNGNIYLPYGILGVRAAADAASACNMNGMYVAQYIASDKYVNWNGNATEPRVYSAGGNNSIGQSQTFALASPSQQAKISVFPNPSRGAVTINLSSYTSKATVVVMDESGRPVMQRVIETNGLTQSISLDLSKGPAQVYVVKVITDNGVQTAKVVIQH